MVVWFCGFFVGKWSCRFGIPIESSLGVCVCGVGVFFLIECVVFY